jgi:hypothetical protein
MPFAPYPILTFSNAGYWITTLPDRYEITLHRGAAGPLRITSNSPPVALLPEERKATFDQLAPRFSRDTPASTVRPGDIPAVKPRVRGVQTDADGRIWVRLHTTAEKVELPAPALANTGAAASARGTGAPPPAVRWVEPTVFDIFAASGEFLGRLRWRSNGTFMDASGKYAWAREYDSLDVPRMVRYTISAASPRVPSAGYWSGR